MRLEIGLVRELITLIARTLLHEVQNAMYATVEISLIELAAFHASHDTVELLVLTGLQHIVACPHLLGAVLATEPIGHDGSLVAPFVAENGLDEILALRSVDTIYIIIRGHHRPGLTFLDGYLEALQIDLTESSL